MFDSRYKAGGYFRCYKRDAETSREWKKKHPARDYLNEANRDITRRRKAIENA